MQVTPESREVLVSWWVNHCPVPEWYDIVEQVLRHLEHDRWERLQWSEVHVAHARRRDIATEVRGLRVIVDLTPDFDDCDVADLVAVVFDPDSAGVVDEWELP